MSCSVLCVFKTIPPAQTRAWCVECSEFVDTSITVHRFLVHKRKSTALFCPECEHLDVVEDRLRRHLLLVHQREVGDVLGFRIDGIVTFKKLKTCAVDNCDFMTNRAVAIARHYEAVHVPSQRRHLESDTESSQLDDDEAEARERQLQRPQASATVQLSPPRPVAASSARSVATSSTRPVTAMERELQAFLDRVHTPLRLRTPPLPRRQAPAAQLHQDAGEHFLEILYAQKRWACAGVVQDRLCGFAFTKLPPVGCFFITRAGKASDRLWIRRHLGHPEYDETADATIARRASMRASLVYFHSKPWQVMYKAVTTASLPLGKFAVREGDGQPVCSLYVVPLDIDE